jgi:hypothetical protein
MDVKDDKIDQDVELTTNVHTECSEFKNVSTSPHVFTEWCLITHNNSFTNLPLTFEYSVYDLNSHVAHENFRVIVVTRLHKSQHFGLKLRCGFWSLFEQPLPDFATLKAAWSNDIVMINKHFSTYVMRCYFLLYSASVIHPPTHNLYLSQRTSTIRTVNSCRIIGVEHAAGTEGIPKYIIFWLVHLKGRSHTDQNNTWLIG